MKILAISDIHGDGTLSKRVAKKAKKEKIDLVILAGDITWLEEPMKNVIKPFADLGKEILIMPGNHETNDTITELKVAYPSLINIDQEPFQKNKVGFFGAGYGFESGPFSIDESLLKEKLIKSQNKIKDLRKKVLITHSHHEGSNSEFSGFPGSKSIRKSIEYLKPNFAIHGHIHEASGIKEKIGSTKIVNVSRKPFIFEI
jgi:Icc-related predicted phosphoesterase